MTRPGFDTARLPSAVAAAWHARRGDAAALHDAPAGRSFLLEGLDLDVSATSIRHALATGGADAPALVGLVPTAVLDYIRANHLYRS